MKKLKTTSIHDLNLILMTQISMIMMVYVSFGENKNECITKILTDFTDNIYSLAKFHNGRRTSTG